jgi:D-sedoheptulose 7-phosphate isomerase
VNRLEDIFQERSGSEGFARGYLDYVAEVLATVDTKAVARFAEVLLDARERDAQIFFLGNGGSAATASHFVNDIAIGTRTRTKPFRAVSLTDNLAALTAIANDHGYDDVFVRQLEYTLREGDVVVAISVSGNSPNVVSAVEYAIERSARPIALTGFDGGRLRELCDVVVHVPTNPGEYGPAEDVHMILDHLVTAYLAQVCAAEVASQVS